MTKEQSRQRDAPHKQQYEQEQHAKKWYVRFFVWLFGSKDLSQMSEEERVNIPRGKNAPRKENVRLV